MPCKANFVIRMSLRRWKTVCTMMPVVTRNSRYISSATRPSVVLESSRCGITAGFIIVIVIIVFK